MDGFSFPLADVIGHIPAEVVCINGQYGRVGKDAGCFDDTTQVGVELPLQGLSSVNILWISRPALMPLTTIDIIVRRVRPLMIAKSMMFLPVLECLQVSYLIPEAFRVA